MSLFSPSWYEVLEVSVTATTEEIKCSYRRLAKQHHPDVQGDCLAGDSHRIRQINEAYAVLRQQESRRQYDDQLRQAAIAAARQHRHANPQTRRRTQTTVTDEETARSLWIRQVYTPINRSLGWILRSLNPQLDDLSADPFDADLVDAFANYIDNCRSRYDTAYATFRSHPNPSTLAGVATRLYYCLDRVEDALDELGYFPLNLDDRHLHTGQELFRIAQGLRQEAMEVLHDSVAR